ncbi:MAG: plasmid stabilization protein [Alphaproteobacteria bacterium]
MPQGDKSSYSDKQKRQAEHIEEGYEDRGTGKKEAERRAWATVNKETGGGKKSGSGRGKKTSTASSKKGGRIGGKNSHKGTKSKSSATKSTSAKSSSRKPTARKSSRGKKRAA